MKTTENINPAFEVCRAFGIPKRIRATKGTSKYPIHALAHLDAIVGTEKAVRGAAVAARAYRKANPKTRFSIFKLEDGDYALVRIS